MPLSYSGAPEGAPSQINTKPKSNRRDRSARLPNKESAAKPSSPSPLLHHLHKILEQIMRVMRSRRRLRVILHAEQRQRPVTQAFKRVVVKIDVGEIYFHT